MTDGEARRSARRSRGHPGRTSVVDIPGTAGQALHAAGADAEGSAATRRGQGGLDSRPGSLGRTLHDCPWSRRDSQDAPRLRQRLRLVPAQRARWGCGEFTPGPPPGHPGDAGQPECGAYWNTLGAAAFRAGDPTGAIAALERSIALTGGGNAFDHIFISMANGQLGRREEARRWYVRATAWIEEHDSHHSSLLALYEEAGGAQFASRAIPGPLSSRESPSRSSTPCGGRFDQGVGLADCPGSRGRARRNSPAARLPRGLRAAKPDARGPPLEAARQGPGQPLASRFWR